MDKRQRERMKEIAEDLKRSGFYEIESDPNLTEEEKFFQKIKKLAESGDRPSITQFYAERMFGKSNGKGLEEGLSGDEFNDLARRVKEALRQEYESGCGCCPVCNRPKVLHDEPRLDSNEGETTEAGEVAALALSD